MGHIFIDSYPLFRRVVLSLYFYFGYRKDSNGFPPSSIRPAATPSSSSAPPYTSLQHHSPSVCKSVTSYKRVIILRIKDLTGLFEISQRGMEVKNQVSSTAAPMELRVAASTGLHFTYNPLLKVFCSSCTAYNGTIIH